MAIISETSTQVQPIILRHLLPIIAASAPGTVIERRWHHA
jgi:hypothetical protein